MNRMLPDEPLAESAWLAHRLAREHCAVDTATGESCAWYHGFWQFMRLMGLAKTAGGHADFLVEELRVQARSGGYPRLLISGTADYSMAALATYAYAQEHAQIELSLVDRCETPLALARWYGARSGSAVTTYRSDILDFKGAKQYDVVMTNSFLGYFDLPQRKRLFAAWATLLRPGGRLILTNRIRPGTGYAPVGFTPDQARAFTDAIRAEAQRAPAGLLEADEMARLAQAYAEQFRSVPVRSKEEVAELIRAGGFRIDRLDVAPAPGRARGGAIAGPTLAETTDYVRIAATRL